MECECNVRRYFRHRVATGESLLLLLFIIHWNYWKQFLCVKRFAFGQTKRNEDARCIPFDAGRRRLCLHIVDGFVRIVVASSSASTKQLYEMGEIVRDAKWTMMATAATTAVMTVAVKTERNY